ncbi:hypothetical protein KX729_25730 [Rhizobium sp. XQZ8]|uniref:hypothetical protein n=1 Tax=Rhizobium populisoli TaxID=2859785 RepID=UPI001CA48EC1|nr:hypothetical protein [Rhizobium populisoli]MBW6424854.1 hypothetical protein [Rhizobium populisoli]
MKTPWRFLADLVSRKPALGRADKANESADIQALEYHPLQDVADALQSHNQGQDEDRTGGLASSAAVSDHPAAGYATSDLGETTPPSVDLNSSVAFVEEIVALDTSHRRADEEAMSLKQPSNRRKAEARRFDKVAEALTPADGHPSEFVATTPVAAKTAVDEMAELDAEIQDLRKRLARKLSVQNRYLKQMLNRYDSK